MNNKTTYKTLSKRWGYPEATIRQWFSRYELTDAYKYSKNMGKSCRINPGKYDWTYVYYLPEEHYVGITTNVTKRCGQHRANGFKTDGVEIMGKFERRVDAHLLETMFHVRGYHGFRDLSRK